MQALNGLGRAISLNQEFRVSLQQCRYRKKNYWRTTYGPNYCFRPGTYFIGIRQPPLKYFSIPSKKPSEPYGLQGTNHLLPGKGKIAARLPVKVTLLKDKVYSWCACGYSHNQPYCDGSHMRESTKLKPVRYIPEKDMEVWLCQCKQTNNRPFCDGTHETLPPPEKPEKQQK